MRLSIVMMAMALPLLAADLEKALADVAKALPERQRRALEKQAEASKQTLPKLLADLLKQAAWQAAVQHDPEAKKRYEAAQNAATAAKQAEADLQKELSAVVK
jgi:hypothetical protein